MTSATPLKGMVANSILKAKNTDGDMAGSRSHNYRIASIPADGVGPEVVSAAIEVVQKLSGVLKTFSIEFTHIQSPSLNFRTILIFSRFAFLYC